MAKFKKVPQTFLYKKLLVYWGNMVKNYDGDCRDDDFFDVVRNCFDHEKGVELIGLAYSDEELKEMKSVKFRRSRLDLSDSLDEVFCSLWNFSRLRRKCRIVLDSICEYMRKDIKNKGSDIIEQRIGELAKVLKLSELETEILTFAYVRSETCFCWPVRVDDREKPLYYAMALDRSYPEVMEAMSPRGNLLKFNLLDSDFDFSCRTIGAYMDGSSDTAINRRFYHKSEMSDILPWQYFGELSARDGEVLKKMISATGGRCNILLYGAPGTGKTSFARSLAKELGRTSYEVAHGEDDGRNMKAETRMIGIRVCNDQEDAKESIMIIDEADELLRGDSHGFTPFGLGFNVARSTEKGVTNTILDEMKIPTIWISNAPPEAMDESVRRRFDYSICFERLNNAQRVAIWRNLIEKHDIGDLIPESEIEGYATKYETSAGGISTVLENVKRMRPTAEKTQELIATLMRPHCKLMGVKESNRFLPAQDYSLEGLNIKGKVSLDKVVKAVGNYLNSSYNDSAVDKPRMNLLMFGPPGTGKTEFVKYLGKTLGRKVLVMKGSDILGMYVGESEKNIARAFRQAEAEKAILFFDEIDGLLQNRENARANWEVTQVNELLQQMENFDGVMVAATNFCKNLDPATMRRFTFKLEFGYLDDAGKKLFFERMFKTSLSKDDAAELDKIGNLAPGDFRTVRQEMFYLGEGQTNEELIAALKEECSLKKDDDSLSKIGF
jgi:SpoVK/Ycf46/Vps4 family AAA+-type ATPase